MKKCTVNNNDKNNSIIYPLSYISLTPQTLQSHCFPNFQSACRTIKQDHCKWNLCIRGRRRRLTCKKKIKGHVRCLFARPRRRRHSRQRHQRSRQPRHAITSPRHNVRRLQQDQWNIACLPKYEPNFFLIIFFFLCINSN